MANDFRPTPDHQRQAGVPEGKVEEMTPWKSTIFANTIRDWWVYVPAQYKADQPAAVMFFQDGHDYVNVKGNWRVPIVFDNLIARGEMPVTIAVFINPGHDIAKGDAFHGVRWQASNRSLEYDSLGDRYARFLIEEILPAVKERWTISDDPNHRAIGGASSGGICSFTACWERPDQFRKVFSTIGSYVNLRGGDAYPSLIRKTERRPLRVFLEDSSGDIDNKFGNWPLANQQMNAALRYMGYDVRFDYVEGYAHNSNHGGSIFPDALRWLWRKEEHKPAPSAKQDLGGDLSLHRLLIEGKSWEPVAQGLGFADGPCADAAGNFYYSDLKANEIWKIALDGTKTKVLAEGASGLKFGTDGRLYACQPGKKRVVAIDLTQPDGAIKVLAENVQPNDLVVSRHGQLYFTETGKKQVTRIDLKSGQVSVADEGITAPNGITLSSDQGTLAVSDYRGQHIYFFQVQASGELAAKSTPATMRRPIDPKGEFKFNEPPPYQAAAGGDGMFSDEQGRFYVATTLGVQVFDAGGRECGLLPKPLADKPLTSCTLAGPERAYLYITNGDQIFRRQVQARGSNFAQP
jgi:enterochelin esterase family protein